MRQPLLPQDVITLTRAVMRHSPQAQPQQAVRILAGATRAAVYARLVGRCHPRWGDGSLDSAARRMGLHPEPFWDDPDFLAALQVVVAALSRRLRA